MTNTMVQQKEKPPIEVGARGVVFRCLEDIWRFAHYIIKADAAPPSLKSPEALVVAIEYGLEIGLTPMQAVQNVAVVYNRPAVYGDAMLALCMASGLFDHSVFEERFEGNPYEDDYRAVCTVGRLGRKQPITRSFSVAQAKLTGLWERSEAWKRYPDRMLQMRARSWALRDAFPDVLKGVYAVEELEGSAIPVTDEKPLTGTAALAAKLLAKESTVEPLPTGGHAAVEAAAAREVAAGPNGTIQPVGEAALGEEDLAEDELVEAEKAAKSLLGD